MLQFRFILTERCVGQDYTNSPISRRGAKCAEGAAGGMSANRQRVTLD